MVTEDTEITLQKAASNFVTITLTEYGRLKEVEGKYKALQGA